MSTPEPRPVPVHVSNANELGGVAAYDCKSIYRTITLTALEPAQEIFGASDDRIIAWVTAIDADIVLHDVKSDAAAGHGSYVPSVTPSSGKPNLSAPYPVQDYRTIYAAPVTALTGTNVLRVSVTAVYRK